MDSVCIHTHWASARSCARKVRSEKMSSGTKSGQGYKSSQPKPAHRNVTSGGNVTLSEEKRGEMANKYC